LILLASDSETALEEANRPPFGLDLSYTGQCWKAVLSPS